MDPGMITGICIVIVVIGLVFWLPVLVFFPLIKSIADKISGKSVQVVQIKQLQLKIEMLEHELHDVRSRQLALEDSHKFDQQLSKSQKKD